MATWDPHQYQRFQKERAQPFFDLLSRVSDYETTSGAEVAEVADLGCGPGTLTVTLAARWPRATVWGIDNSPQMLSEAVKLLSQQSHQNVHFIDSDLAAWQPGKPLDRIISNAALQWLPEHVTLLPRLVSLLTPQGILGVQMPNNFAQAAHQLLGETVRQERWRAILEDWREHYFGQSPQWYAGVLQDLGSAVQVWETIYYHILSGENAVLEWMKGTTLRPVLSRLDADQQAAFLKEYGQKLSQAYPAGPSGTIFPFRRLFFIAQRA